MDILHLSVAECKATPAFGTARLNDVPIRALREKAEERGGHDG
jgi:hypothetical protein